MAKRQQRSAFIWSEAHAHILILPPALQLRTHPRHAQHHCVSLCVWAEVVHPRRSCAKPNVERLEPRAPIRRPELAPATEAAGQVRDTMRLACRRRRRRRPRPRPSAARQWRARSQAMACRPDRCFSSSLALLQPPPDRPESTAEAGGAGPPGRARAPPAPSLDPAHWCCAVEAADALVAEAGATMHDPARSREFWDGCGLDMESLDGRDVRLSDGREGRIVGVGKSMIGAVPHLVAVQGGPELKVKLLREGNDQAAFELMDCRWVWAHNSVLRGRLEHPISIASR